MLAKSNEMKKLFKNIASSYANTYSIHYACESLNDSNQNISPRVTAISILHFDTRATHSFAIHLEAEIKKIDVGDIEEHYDELEANLLRKFFKHAKDHSNDQYIHWNMRNAIYGFEALEHRYRVLTSEEPFRIPEKHRYNLNDLLKKKYCEDYIGHSRMQKLMSLNGGSPQHFMTGAEEVKAFQDKEYVRLYLSNIDKITWLYSTFELALKNKLNVEKSGFRQKVIDFTESTTFKVAGILALVISFIRFSIYVYKKSG